MLSLRRAQLTLNTLDSLQLRTAILRIPKTVGWTADLPEGWEFIRDGHSVRVDLPDQSSLTITNVDPGPSCNARKWIEAVDDIAKLRGRRSDHVVCGEFSGVYTEFAAADEWLRGWALEAAGFALDITYRCRLLDRGKEDDRIDRILATLRYNHAAV